MQLTLRYPVYQILAILTSTLTVLHVGVPIIAPPVHAYDLSSLLLWAGSIPSFVIIIWAYCRETDDLFLSLKSDDYSSTNRVRSSTDTAAEDTRFKALFIMTSASAATCKPLTTTPIVSLVISGGDENLERGSHCASATLCLCLTRCLCSERRRC